VESVSMGLGPVADVVGVLAITNPYDDGVASLWDRLTEPLADDDLRALPKALAAAVPLVAREPAILALVAELAVMADLGELAEPILDVAVGQRDLRSLLAAASLIGNPSAEPGLHAHLRSALDAWPLGHELERLVLIRADPTVAPETAREEALLRQRWPGAESNLGGPPTGAPTVVIDDELPARLMAQLTGELLHRQTPMRRLYLGCRPVAPWFAREGVVAVVTGPGRSAILSHYPRFPEGRLIWSTGGRGRGLNLRDILRKIDRELPSARPQVQPSVSSSTPFAPEVYLLGAYDAHEVSFHTGAKTGHIYRLAKANVLVPRQRAQKIWSFRDVVAIRALTYLQSRSAKRVDTLVVRQLASFAGDAAAHSIGVTNDGRVLADHGDGFHDVVSGERVFEGVVALDQAFQPFTIGGSAVPDLLHPAAETSVHPAIARGTPCVQGTRITARSIARLAERTPIEDIPTYYPELGDRDLKGPLQVGQILLSH